jgi:RING-box protein 1
MESKFTINSIKILSSWGYKLSSNTDCTICRCSLDGQSIYNQEKGVDSIITRGTCGHSFHEECIKPWITINNHCPICSAEWSLKK